MPDSAAGPRSAPPATNGEDNLPWLETLEQIRQTYQLIGGAALFGAHLVEIERGRAVFRLPISLLLGGGAAGGVHGGILSALTDIAGVSAVRSLCRVNDVMRGTAEMNISYLRPATGRELRVTGTVLKQGESIAVSDVEIHNDEGKLVAKGRVAYALGKTPRGRGA